MGSVKAMALIVALCGLMSFIAGIMAENKKPASGIPIKRHGVMICKFDQSDQTIVWGYVSIVCFIVSTLVGFLSLFYPHKGKHVPRRILYSNGGFHLFFNISLLTTCLAGAFLVWPTLTERNHVTKNIHHNLQTDCASAKTGLLGGGAFFSLDASLFWLVTLMLVGNVREDYYDGKEENHKIHENGNGNGNGNGTAALVNDIA